MIFFADKVLYPVEWRIFCVLQGCDVHLWFQKDKSCPWIYEGEDMG
jgi:hypothetical protein